MLGVRKSAWGRKKPVQCSGSRWHRADFLTPSAVSNESHQLADIVRVILGVLDKLFDRDFI
jgi:hypothetical protein